MYCLVIQPRIFIHTLLLPKEPSLDDYWTLKRSHPIYGFDYSSYKHGLQEVQTLRNEVEDIELRSPEMALPWQEEGPYNIGGRINVVTPVHRTSDTIFAGSANGGVFRTTDGGINWTPLFDDIAEKAIGAIAIHPSDPKTIFVGTGDRKFGGHSYNGNGVLKSTDLGNTWTNIGLTDVGIISACIVNPQNPNEILVGALGSGFEKTTNRGVYKTTDGGATWTNTLFVSDSSGISEMVADPSNPQIVYAANFNRANLPDRSISKGPDAKIFKSTDGGSTWTQLTNGLPNIDLSRVGITISESNPNKLYAIYTGTDYQIYEIYVSSDAGASWTALNANSGLNGLDGNTYGGFGWYFGTIFVNPFNENHVIIQGVDQYESFDGGQNWTMNVPEWWTYEVHADKHSLYFKDANSIVIGTDGGMYETSNLGGQWNVLGELPVSQFYRATAHTFTTGRYAGGLQDNGSTSGNASQDWSRDFGGDGFEVTYVDEGSNLVIYETQRGGIYWSDNFNGVVDLTLTNDLPGENTNWNTAYKVFSDFSLVAGSNRLLEQNSPPFDNWSPISNDLTQTAFGATTPEKYHTISEIALSPFDEDELIVGTTDGLVWRGNADGGINNWTNVTGTLPTKYVSSVNFSKRVQNKLYVTLTGYYNNFSQALVFKSEDDGATWTDISSNLPAIGINTLITYDIDNSEALLIGTDAGVFLSENDGQSWELLGTGLPIVTVSALDIDEQTEQLIAGTYGRSMWSYDLTWYVELHENELSTLVYPNPAKDKLSIDEAVNKLVISTMDGRVVLEDGNLSQGDEVDISQLKSGSYIIILDETQSKLIVE